MRFTATLALLALAAPLSAQLTPEQRQQREDAEFARHYNQQSSSALERRTLEGDPSAYAGPSGCDARRIGVGGCSYNTYYRPWRSPAAQQNHWAWLQSEAAAPRRLRLGGTGIFRAKAEAASTLTLASPIGGTGKALRVRTTIEGEADAPTWSSTRELTGDAEERYLVPIPAFEAGKYRITIEVYDPKSPDAPYSTSANTLKIN